MEVAIVGDNVCTVANVSDNICTVANGRANICTVANVVTVANGRLALDQITSGLRFDVILCDLMMPLMTGMEFHEQLKVVAPEQVSRIVFLTGGALTSAARAFLDMSSNPLLEKPFDARELRQLVEDRVQAVLVGEPGSSTGHTKP